MACELEQEKESWREFELETEKLKWSSEFEQKLSLEKESWEKTVLEPLKMKLKQDFEEKLQAEKVCNQKIFLDKSCMIEQLAAKELEVIKTFA